MAGFSPQKRNPDVSGINYSSDQGMPVHQALLFYQLREDSVAVHQCPRAPPGIGRYVRKTGPRTDIALQTTRQSTVALTFSNSASISARLLCFRPHLIHYVAVSKWEQAAG